MAQSWAGKLPSVVRGYNMSTQSSTRLSPFYLLHGWHPKIPLNTVEIPRLTREQISEMELEERETNAAADNLCSLSSPDETGLSQRQRQIDQAEQDRAQAGANIQVARNDRGRTITAAEASPKTLKWQNPLASSRWETTFSSENETPTMSSSQEKRREAVRCAAPSANPFAAAAQAPRVKGTAQSKMQPEMSGIRPSMMSSRTTTPGWLPLTR